ncbi:MAG TPA: glycosyltransferase family 87 protein [Acidimicrobiales bacterium]|nr:glycosyltransferase family 87 protein [Acidimicrobiales bacterium]
MSAVAEQSLDETLVEELEAATAGTRRRRRGVAVAVLVAFVLTRLLAGYIADHPDFYGPNRPDGTGDVRLYDYNSWEIRHDLLNPYGPQLRVEYPPGAIPIIMVPRFVRALSYRTEFIIFMVLFDAVGLWGLARIARRAGSWWGFAAWFVLIPALGPVTYTRFDLVVAVAMVWAIERALAGKWGWVGVLIGVGAAVKLVPAVLLPILFFVAPRDKRRALLGGFGAVLALAIAPFVRTLPDLYDSVIQYHSERGIQAESLWGAGLLVARRLADYPVAIVASHRAWDAQSAASDTLKTISNAAALLVVGTGVVLAVRTRIGDVRRVTLLSFGVLSLLVGVGKVYSPQYVVWLIALGAVAMALAPRLAAPAVGVLAVTTALAHLEFPIWFWDVLFYDKGGALVVLAVRDALTVVVGLLGLWAWRRSRTEEIVLTG